MVRCGRDGAAKGFDLAGGDARAGDELVVAVTSHAARTIRKDVKVRGGVYGRQAADSQEAGAEALYDVDFGATAEVG